MRTGRTRRERHEVRVQGRPEPRWATWSDDGSTLRPRPEGTTVLTGTAVDQTALDGLLQSLRALGLPLVHVTRTQDDGGEPPASGDSEPNARRPAPFPYRLS